MTVFLLDGQFVRVDSMHNEASAVGYITNKWECGISKGSHTFKNTASEKYDTIVLMEGGLDWRTFKSNFIKMDFFLEIRFHYSIFTCM